MKAIIVIEMSDKQWEFLNSADVMLTNGLGAVTVYPCVDIRPMPQKKELKGGWYHPADVWMEGANFGYNACIDEITGETE